MNDKINTLSGIVETWEISGFGLNGYENACQKMLWTGIKYLSKLDCPLEIFKGTHETKLRATKDTKLFGAVEVKQGETINLVGILNTPESCRELEAEMMKSVDNDCTGAMHQYVMGHLKYIAEHGLQGWHKELQTHRQDEKPIKFNLEKMELVGLCQ